MTLDVAEAQLTLARLIDRDRRMARMMGVVAVGMIIFVVIGLAIAHEQTTTMANQAKTLENQSKTLDEQAKAIQAEAEADRAEAAFEEEVRQYLISDPGSPERERARENLRRISPVPTTAPSRARASPRTDASESSPTTSTTTTTTTTPPPSQPSIACVLNRCLGP